MDILKQKNNSIFFNKKINSRFFIELNSKIMIKYKKNTLKSINGNDFSFYFSFFNSHSKKNDFEISIIGLVSKNL